MHYEMNESQDTLLHNCILICTNSYSYFIFNLNIFIISIADIFTIHREEQEKVEFITKLLKTNCYITNVTNSTYYYNMYS